MRLILKKEKARPKAPKTATEKSLQNYLAKLSAVEKYNDGVRAYNRKMVRLGEEAQRRVAGFGKKGKK